MIATCDGVDMLIVIGWKHVHDMPDCCCFLETVWELKLMSKITAFTGIVQSGLFL